MVGLDTITFSNLLKVVIEYLNLIICLCFQVSVGSSSERVILVICEYALENSWFIFLMNGMTWK